MHHRTCLAKAADLRRVPSPVDHTFDSTALTPATVNTELGACYRGDTLPVALFLGLIIAIDLSSLAILLYAKTAGLFQASIHRKLELQEAAQEAASQVSRQGSVSGSPRGSISSAQTYSNVTFASEVPEIHSLSFKELSNRHYRSIVTRLLLYVQPQTVLTC